MGCFRYAPATPEPHVLPWITKGFIMGMTPVQLFESFFEGNLLDCHYAPGDIRRDFNAAVAVSHFADQYFKYNKRHKSNLVPSYDTIGFFIDYLESQTNSAFRDMAYPLY